ncbi:MAG TPA: putative phage abortive infection protein [Bacteroidia bacterium]|nr:putative phage abortive infection protein [Bacteroidia bacterium]
MTFTVLPILLEASSTTDWMQAWAAVISIPSVIIGFYLFFRKDKDREKEIENLARMATEANSQTQKMNEQLAEMKNQTIQIQRGNEQNRENIFEDRLFKLLDQQQNILNSIEYKWKDHQGFHDSKGRKVFGIIKDDFFRICQFLNMDRKIIPNIDREFIMRMSGLKYDEYNSSSAFIESYFINRVPIFEKILEEIKFRQDDEYSIQQSYRMLFNYYHVYIGHYFRHLYHILDTLMVEKIRELSEVKDEEKRIQVIAKFKRYSDWVQAPMSMPEMFLLFYNCIGFPKMRALVNHFQFLENLCFEDLVKIEHAGLFPEIKFKTRKNILINE